MAITEKILVDNSAGGAELVHKERQAHKVGSTDGTV